MRRRAAGFALLIALAIPLGAPGAGHCEAADELDAHLETLRRQVDNRSLEIERREAIALEMAAALDRAAQGEATAEGKRARWTRAIRLIDEFEAENAGHPRSRQFRSQAAVYLWARARLWADQWALSPADREAHDHAVENLDVAIKRLRALDAAPGHRDDALGQNVRFRLAQALADRARLDPDDSEPCRSKLREAVDAIAKPVSDPALQGFALLLKAEVLSRLNDDAEADAALRELLKWAPAPPAAELLEGKVMVLTGLERFAEALTAIDRSSVDAPLKGLLAVQVLLAQRHTLAAKPERVEVETDLFRRIEPLRTSPAAEARLALLALAGGMKEPDPSQGPDAWDALADGAVARGDFERAAALEMKGAERARALGSVERAGALRLRAGAFLFRGQKYQEADAPLTAVVDDPRAGLARPKAALLRAMARGRALALGLPGASTSSYASALEAILRDFPTGPGAGEARWLLGQLRLAGGDREQARELWSAVPRRDPRWLESQLAIAGLGQEEIDLSRIRDERATVLERYQKEDATLNRVLGRCQTASERAEVELARIRLELTPDVGSPESARLGCERILHSASQAEQRDQARRYHLVALAELGHFVEAEREARAEVERSAPRPLLEVARLLDHIASESESDLRMRRFGLILRLLLARILAHEEDLTPVERTEARLRQTRALLLSGDDVRARASLAGWQGNPPASGDRILKDLADTYSRLDAHDLAADVERLRARNAANGSLPWFEARYGLALAYYRIGKEKEARRVIDGTAILHPGLGGGTLRDKFVRLRQRLGPVEE